MCVVDSISKSLCTTKTNQGIYYRPMHFVLYVIHEDFSYKDIDKKACLLVSDAFEAYDSFEYGSNAFVINCKDPKTFL